MTKEEIMEAAGRCPDAADKPTGLGCIHCPLDELNGYRKCAAEFANYIRKTNEPAPAPTETSPVINDDNINSLCDKNNTKTIESQALESARQKLLAIYETLTPEETRAWDLGEVYAEIVRGISGGEYNG